MSSIFNQLIKSVVLFLSCVISLSFVSKAFAEPYLAYKTGNPCSACHVNPTGGGARNSFGNAYGSQLLPENASNDFVDYSNLGYGIGIGGNLRGGFIATDPKVGDDTRGFETETGQIYLHVKPKNSRISFYLDEQIAPNSATNREAFIMLDVNESTYLKMGKILVPFGIRLQDDASFVRTASQSSFANSDNGVELGLQKDKFNFTFGLNNGTDSSRNNDDQFRYAGQVEYLAGPWRLGSGAMINNFEEGDRVSFNIFGGGHFWGLTFLSEIDFIEDDTIVDINGETLGQVVLFAEVNKEVKKGLNLKLTYEWQDNSTEIKDDVRERFSGVIEYTPFANFQLRSGLRVLTDEVENSTVESNTFFAQAHLYY